jgi:hypothetical protein
MVAGDDLAAGYGKVEIFHGASLRVGPTAGRVAMVGIGLTLRSPQDRRPA